MIIAKVEIPSGKYCSSRRYYCKLLLNDEGIKTCYYTNKMSDYNINPTRIVFLEDDNMARTLKCELCLYVNGAKTKS